MMKGRGARLIESNDVRGRESEESRSGARVSSGSGERRDGVTVIR